MKRALLCIVLTCWVLAGCGGEGANDTGADIADLMVPDEVAEIVDSHSCTDERAAALDAGGAETLPHQWDGTPFAVHIGGGFDAPDYLLMLIAEEADRIAWYLGYEVITVGRELPLPAVSVEAVRAGQHDIPLPEPGAALVYCCDRREGRGGWAMTDVPLIVLSPWQHVSEYAIVHELYHLLGFSHPGEPTGVPMSLPLNGTGHADNPTRSTAMDLARLACIYD